jgi:type I restriction-modification system DNA methylase subunit
MKVAGRNKTWKELINKPATEENVDFSNIHSKYLRVLQDKEFTYALFRSLSRDFNGDMFPNIETEERNVKEKHLDMLRNMLYGNTEPQLFFFSYKFDIIPLNLISAIYEEFYQSSAISKTEKSKTEKPTDKKKSRSRQEGAYYTPPSLVEFVLSRVLTKEIIIRIPRILDPACGSGIFLVEAFRRIVRYNYSEGKELSFNNLRKILKEQLIGIEINEEAARITAFSLYLALLNYLDPPSILEHIKNGDRLPNLIVTSRKSDNHFNIIHDKNAFNLSKEIIGRVDIVIGNPPWGSPGKKASADVKKQNDDMLSWCNKKGFTIGDQEPSQAFLLFALDILGVNGHCAMLTSSGVFLGLKRKTVAFRKALMTNVCLTEVFNFSHVREFFFNGAISPFFFVHYKKQEQKDTPVIYWSPKQIKYTENTQSIFLSKYDRAFIVNQNLISNKTWKINWFGRHADYIFISQLDNLKRLLTLVDRDKSGQGYKETPAVNAYPDVSSLKSLIITSFDKYTKLRFEKAPEKFHRKGIDSVYHGPRLLFKKGISTKTYSPIVTRYEKKPFCFTNSIDGLKFIENNENVYLLVLGILWSLFSKYYFFHVSAKWGIWHDEIYLDEELLYLPIPDKLTGKSAMRVVSLVKKLREYNPQLEDLFNKNGIQECKIEKQRKQWEAEIDEAVFDLYGLKKKKKELIRDFNSVTLEFFYKPYNCGGIEPVIREDNTQWIKDYAIRFSDCWQPYLNSDETLRADLCVALSENIVALEFYISDIDDDWDLLQKDKLWDKILDEIADYSERPLGSSEILVESIIQVITNDSIIIIKRNEKRFWTKSIAYEDAESTLTKRILGTSTITGSTK